MPHIFLHLYFIVSPHMPLTCPCGKGLKLVKTPKQGKNVLLLFFFVFFFVMKTWGTARFSHGTIFSENLFY